MAELELTPEDRAAAEAAEQAALREDRPVAWAGSGVRGTVAPGHGWVMDGKTCRAYAHHVSAAGTRWRWRGAACRHGDEAWKVVSAAAGQMRAEPRQEASR